MYRKFKTLVLGLLAYVTPSNFFSRFLRSEALVYNSFFFFFRTAVLWKLFDSIIILIQTLQFLTPVCLLVKMESKTVTRSITACKPRSWNLCHARPLLRVEFLMSSEHRPILVDGLLAYVTPSNFFSRFLRSEALVYNSYFFRTAIVRKLFDIRFPCKHCNFSRVCLLVKMASKTVTRSIYIQFNPETVDRSY